ncbi:hypothetical protein CANMA_003899 [Candida margitis]|uniref:uncharacterized protein n=1 Tax=Candida margitis TaxID=1775924 RepID=UPI002227FF5F|nr:uncharacterized protein CANMA_003899 [Candida margitis]KAI5961125.1 hypothetical protein CANMA_003899 [Candida margitis]
MVRLSLAFIKASPKRQNLPFQVVQQVFLNINQHQALALAPLHSKFYNATRDKLYQNIYIYGEFLYIPLKGDAIRFKFHKDINNFRTNKYTVVSKYVLYKCMSQIRQDVKINHLILSDYDETLIKQVLGHFQSIRTFEVIRSFGLNRQGHLTFHKEMSRELMFSDMRANNLFSNTVFIPPPFNPNQFEIPSNIKTSLSLFVTSDIVNWDFLHPFPFITNLTVLAFRRDMLTKRVENLRLHKLHLHHLMEVVDYTISDVFNTIALRELTIVGYIQIEKVFPNHKLDEEYPQLAQFCLRHNGEETQEFTIRDLLNFSHINLSMLILATKFSNPKTARAISWLCLYFPKASINWWFEPRGFPIRALGINNCITDSAFTNDIYMLSPQLPFGVIGYHFPKLRIINRTGGHLTFLLYTSAYINSKTMAANSTNVAVPYSYAPTAKLFTAMIGKQLEVFQTKIELVFAEGSEDVDFRNYCLVGMDLNETTTFKNTCHQICSLKFDYHPIRAAFTAQTKRALNEVIQDYCSFVKAAWKGIIPYSFLMNNFLSAKFSFQLCQIDFPVESGIEVTETVNDVYSLKKYQINTDVLSEITLNSFYNEESAPIFQLPTDDVGSKECHFSVMFSHWLRPFFNMIKGQGIQQPTIKTTNLDQTDTWAEPDWDLVDEDKENFFAELKRTGLSSFCDGSVGHLKILAQAGVYFRACKSNTGFVVTPLIISRIGFNVPEDLKELEGSSNGDTRHSVTPLAIDVFNHASHNEGGLLAAWFSMLMEKPLRTLSEPELEQLEVTLQELKTMITEKKKQKQKKAKKPVAKITKKARKQ